jgi:two-component system, NarL family, sensor kinase
VVAINAKAAAWYGNLRPAELIGRRFWDLAGERAPERSWVRGAMQSETPVSGEIASSDGRWLQMHAYPSAAGLSIFCHDVTEQRIAEQAAQSTQALLQSSLDALNAQVAILDASGKIIAANAAWQRAAELLVRLGEHYFVGDNYVEECERARPHQRDVAAGLRQLIRGEIEQFRGEYASDIVTGTWIQLRGSRFGAGDQLRIVVACEDITEVKSAETSLRRLTGRLLRSQDKAQRRIARELHDATAQNLFGAGLGIGHALRLAPRLNRAARAALEESRALIEQSQREIRTVSYLLHPPMLDEAGLAAALRWFSEGFAKRTEVAVEIDIDSGIGRLPPDIEAALFRVAQEALTNVHRHSEASRVFVRFRPGVPSETEPAIVLTIEDDGKGMPPHVLESLRFGRHSHVQNIGIGLAGMRERLHQFGGDLEISSSAQGTTVRATVPVPAFSGLSGDRSDVDVKSAPTTMK